jgi:hypothetical protein
MASALGPESPLVGGSPSGAKEQVSTRELSLVLPPLAGLGRRLGLVSQGLRPGLSSIARQAGSPDHPAAAAVSFHKYVMHQRQDSHLYVAHQLQSLRAARLCATFLFTHKPGAVKS